MYEINPKELHSFLKSKGISCFYHANTVTTSCSFIKMGGLLSRGHMEKLDAPQTSQSSDNIDIKFGVWNDIFIDIMDLHGYFPRQNYYGPVCFALDINLLLDDHLPAIHITTNNPTNWKENESKKYLYSISEYIDNFETNYDNNRLQQNMITIEADSYILPFDKYLKEIIIDDPGINGYFNHAFQRINSALVSHDLARIKISKRQCRNCWCKSNYRQYNRSQLEKLFIEIET